MDAEQFVEPTWIDHAFVPAISRRRAFYLRSATRGDEVYGLEVVGALIEHEVLATASAPLSSTTKLAYLDGVDIVALSDGPDLIGIYCGEDEPSPQEIAIAQANWTLYLRQLRLESELKVTLDALHAEFVTARLAAPERWPELRTEFEARARQLKEGHLQRMRDARREAHQAERKVAA